MAHVEQARLVELALGHPADGDESALRHLAECGRCREELRSMTRVVAAARAADVVDLPTAPPERVWRRILREVADESGAPPSPAGRAGRPPARGLAPVRARASGRDGRSRRLAVGAALCGAGVLVGVAARWAAGRRRARDMATRGRGRSGGSC
ncbi:hypothetical protein [Streptomyces sp. enrichment culture]|uniref:hypothetical protein n=1 Tax=Streptomyces sp. enrichment culture TaxID=1795815 RepID=UPI003F57017A